MKKILVFILIIVLMAAVMTACKKKEEPLPKPTFVPSAYTEAEGNSAYIRLYMPDGAYEKVIPSVQLVYRTSKSLYDAILSALLGLDGVYRDHFTPAFNGDVRCYSAKKYENILFVNLSHEVLNYSQKEMAAGILAITQTFTQIENIRYVSFSAEGRQLYLNGITYRPLYAVGSDTTVIEDFLKPYQLYDNYFALNNRNQSEIVNSILYFNDVDNKYIIPEVRTLLVQNYGYVNTVVDEIVKGPALGDSKKPSFEAGIKRLDNCTYNEKSKTLTVNFLAADTYPSQDKEWSALPALVNSLTQVIPDMEYMSVNIYTQSGEEHVKVYDTYIKTPAYGDLVRSNLNIYLPSKDLSGLKAHTVSLQAYDSNTAYTNILLAILQSKLDGMNNISAQCGLDRLNIADEMLYVSYDGQVIVVNISEKLYQAFQALDKKQEFLLTFSMVNSLCESSGIKRVQFIVNGYTKEYFAKYINISKPLIEAYGMVVK